MNPPLTRPGAVTASDTERGMNALSPVTAPGVLVTAAPAGWSWASGLFSVSVASETAAMRSTSVGDPRVTVSSGANVSGLRGGPGWTVMVVAPALDAAARALD